MNDCESCVEYHYQREQLKKQLFAANLIIGLHGAPKMCSQCRWESRDFFCSILNIPSGNDKRAEKCPYDVFEGKA